MLVCYIIQITSFSLLSGTDPGFGTAHGPGLYLQYAFPVWQPGGEYATNLIIANVEQNIESRRQQLSQLFLWRVLGRHGPLPHGSATGNFVDDGRWNFPEFVLNMSVMNFSVNFGTSSKIHVKCRVTVFNPWASSSPCNGLATRVAHG